MATCICRRLSCVRTCDFPPGAVSSRLFACDAASLTANRHINLLPRNQCHAIDRYDRTNRGTASRRAAGRRKRGQSPTNLRSVPAGTARRVLRTNGRLSPFPIPRLGRLERRLIEAFDELWDNFVDPAEAIYDVDGTAWNRLVGGPAGGPPGMPSATNRNWPKSATNAARWPWPTSSPSTATKTASVTSSAADTPIGPWPRGSEENTPLAPEVQTSWTSSSV